MLFKERTLGAKIKASRATARREYIKAHNGYEIPPWLEIHHVNYCPLDNEPDNLKALTRWVHIDLHSNDVNSEKSHEALNNYFDKELKKELNELNLLCNIHNLEYGKHTTANISNKSLTGILSVLS